MTKAIEPKCWGMFSFAHLKGLWCFGFFFETHHRTFGIHIGPLLLVVHFKKAV